MRSYPSCWNKVLTQLNFRRKRRKPSKRRNYLSRRSLFESLEQRQMLSGDPLLDLSSEETVVAATATAAAGIPQEKFIVFSSQPEFFLIEKEHTAEELDGPFKEEIAAIEPVFAVETVQTTAGLKAIVSLNPAFTGDPPSSLQTLSLELRLDGQVLESYEILIDLAEAEFRERFLADRQEAAAQEVATLQAEVREGWLGEKASVAGRLERGEDVADVTSLDLSAAVPEARSVVTPEATLELVSSLAKRQAERQDVLVDDAERVRLYDQVLSLAEQTRSDKSAAKTDAEKWETADRVATLGRTGLLLAGEIKADLTSKDAATASAALALRDELARLDDPYYTLFTGLGIDVEVERSFTGDGDTKAVAFMETGLYDFSGSLRIDLGERQAMVQVVHHNLLRTAASHAVSGETYVEDGYIYAGDPDDPSGYGASSTDLFVSGSFDIESLVRFDLGQVTDLSEPTPISAATFQLQETYSSTGASVDVLMWNGLFDGGAGSLTDWDESNLNWNHITGTLDYPGNLSQFTQLDTFTSGDTFDVDATEQVRRALLFGDANGDGVFDPSGLRGDVEAFHLAVTNWGAYIQEYGPRANSAADLLARNDGGLGDGVIDTDDIEDFFSRHGRSRGDYNLDGVVGDNQGGVDGIDWAIFNANYGLTNARFGQGDGDFSGVVDAADFDIWNDRKLEDSVAVATPKITFWLRPTDPVNGQFVGFASSEHGTEQGPTLVIEEQPDLALNRFAIESGNVSVDYSVLGDEFNSVTVQVYQVGVGTPIHTATGLDGALGRHSVTIPASVLTSASDGDAFYAVVSGSPASSTPETNLANNSLDFEFSTLGTQVVNSLDDGGVDNLLSDRHTLRELIDANNVLGWFDTITFDASLFANGPQTIGLSDNDGNNAAADPLVLASDIILQGPGAGLLTIDARDDSWVFKIESGAIVTLGGLDITGGSGSSGGGIHSQGILTIDGSRIHHNYASIYGGGIYQSGGELHVTNSTIDSHDNGGYVGGGVYLTGVGHATFTNTTISGNTAYYGGGGIYASNFNTFEMTNSTVAGNTLTSSSLGYGLYFYGSAPASLHNTIVADNGNSDIYGLVASQSSYNLIESDSTGAFTSANNNQIGADPSLAPLGRYGGPTPTHALLPGSLAIDKGSVSFGSVDQRGFAHYDDPAISGVADIGAYEYQADLSLVVNTTADANVAPGELSLRQALNLARALPGVDTITFDTGVFGSPQEILLDYDGADTDTTPDELLIDSNLNISGPGADLLTISGEGQSRIFNVDASATASIEGMRLADGYAIDSGGAIANYGALTLSGVVVSNSGDSTGADGATRRGGALFNESATLIIEDSYFEGNEAEYGGAIYTLGNSVVDIETSTFSDNRARYEGQVVAGGALRVYGYGANASVTVDHSTFSGNRSDGYGGAIGIVYASVAITSSTLTSNTALGSGGGIVSNGGTTLDNSIIAGNAASNADAWGGVSGSNNLLGPGSQFSGTNNIFLAVNDPKLEPLGDYGGPTRTHALLEGSPAIDAGDSSLVTEPFDQRGTGFSRIRGGGVDVGAFESPEITIWREAENSDTLTQDLHVVGDLTASGNRLISYFLDNGQPVNSLTPTTGIASYDFDITTAGQYVFWARTIAPNNNADAFSVRLDGDVWILWDAISHSTDWTWSKIHDSNNAGLPIEFNLTAGQHTLEIAYREDAAQLDKLLITNDLGFMPTDAGGDDPETVGLTTFDLTATVRDFHSKDWVGGVTTQAHPDFQLNGGSQVDGLVGPTLLNGKPVYVGGSQLTGQAEFEQWYADDPTVNLPADITMRMMEDPTRSGVFQFVGSLSNGVTASTHEFYPIDGQLFGDPISPEHEPHYSDGAGKADEIVEDHNYHFTLELNAEFTYMPGQAFEILQADDDLWVFINNQRVVDLGGLHGPLPHDPVDLDLLGLTPFETYSFDLFFAERHTEQSHLVFETTIDSLRPVSEGILLTEDADLLTTNESETSQSVEFTVPAGAEAIRIDFSNLTFDESSQEPLDPPDVNDAFEITILRKSDGRPALSTIDSDSDAIFNITQGQIPVWSAGVELLDSGGTLIPNPTSAVTEGYVQIDISSLNQGEELVLVARIVNNDSDNNTKVEVDFNVSDLGQGFFVMQGSGTAQALEQAVNQSDRINPHISYSQLHDVTRAFDIEYQHTSFEQGNGNGDSDQLLTRVKLTKKTGGLQVRGDLLLAVDGIANQVTGSFDETQFDALDGRLPISTQGLLSGTPFVYLSNLLDSTNGFYDDGATVEHIELVFTHPDPLGANERFDFNLVVLGELNDPPQIVSDPFAEVRGNAYPVDIFPSGTNTPVQILEIVAGNDFLYTPDTTDPNGDRVRIEVVHGPVSATDTDNDGFEDSVSWSTVAADEGVHQFRLRAIDEHGAFDPALDQVFQVRVVIESLNRPPQFTSPPETLAYVGETYEYFATAFDPEGHDLDFTGVLGAQPRQYEIALAAFAGQSMEYFTFVNENGVADGVSSFSNIRLYESNWAGEPQVLRLDASRFESYTADDGEGKASVVGDGSVVRLTGDAWRKHQLATPYDVTSNSVLSLTFASEGEGDLHGIGLTDNVANDHWFQLYGTALGSAATVPGDEVTHNGQYDPIWTQGTFSVHQDTGLVTWEDIPSDAIGEWVQVDLAVTENELFTPLLSDAQSYQILVGADPFNNPPVIITPSLPNYTIPALVGSEVVDGDFTVYRNTPENPNFESELKAALFANATGITLATDEDNFILRGHYDEGQQPNDRASAGTFADGNLLSTYGLSTHGIVLSTGDVRDYGSYRPSLPTPMGHTGPDNGIGSSGDLPNNAGSPADLTSVNSGEPLYELLESITEVTSMRNLGVTISDYNDITTLEVVFTVDDPAGINVVFDVVFGSEEWGPNRNTFVGSSLIDAFGIFLNPFDEETGEFVPGSNISAPSGFVPFADPVFPNSGNNHPAFDTWDQILPTDPDYDVNGPTDQFRVSGDLIGTTEQPVSIPLTADHPQVIDPQLLPPAVTSSVSLEPNLDGVLWPKELVDSSLVDQATPVMSFQLQPVEGKNRLLFVIADSGDSSYDTTVFISSLSTVSTEPYAPFVEAIDIDNDPLTYTIVKDPVFEASNPAFVFADTATVSNDPANKGQIEWDPQAAGDYYVKVIVDDGRGGTDEEIFTIHVDEADSGLNQAPDLAPIGNQTAMEGRPFELPVTVDQLGETDPLFFSLENAPTGMSIDLEDGTISYTPPSGSAGQTYTGIKIVVQDNSGLTDEETFDLSVVAFDSAGNNSPVIDSSPQLSILGSDLYRYQANATDVDFDKLAWRKVEGPSGLTVTEDGLVIWDTVGEEFRDYSIVISVSDGFVDVPHDWTLSVIEPNVAPVIEPTPFYTAVVGDQRPNEVGIQPWTHQIEATDGNGDTLFYELSLLTTLDSGPSPTIDQNGLITWEPPHVGDFTMEVVVRDGRGGEDNAFFTLPVRLGNAAPELQFGEFVPIVLDEPWSLSVSATDDNDLPSSDPASLLRFSIDAIAEQRGITIDEKTGLLEWTPSDDEAAQVLLTVTDSGDPSEPTAPPLSRSFYLTLPVNVRTQPPGVNEPARIDSEPGNSSAVGRTWTYLVNASDLDGPKTDIDISVVSFVDANGVSLQGELILDDAVPANTDGDLLIQWTPQAGVAGPVQLVVSAIDNNGLGDGEIRTFDMLVRENTPPFILTAVEEAELLQGDQQAYPFTIVDFNRDELRFEILTPAPGTGFFSSDAAGLNPISGFADMVVSDDVATPSTFYLQFTADAVGQQEVTVRVTDAMGDFAEHTIELNVIDDTNVAPDVSLTVPSTLFLGDTLDISVLGANPDADGDRLSYYLLDHLGNRVTEIANRTAGTGLVPTRLRINESTGQISWTPSADQVTTGASDRYSFTVQVTDGRFVVDLGPADMRVVEQPVTEKPPFIVGSLASARIPTNSEFRLPIDVIDFGRDATGTEQLTFSQTGIDAAWSPVFSPASITDPSSDPSNPDATELVFTPDASGSFSVTIVVTDLDSHTAEHKIEIEVFNPAVPNTIPGGSLRARDTAAVDEQYVGRATGDDPDPGDVPQFYLLVDNGGTTEYATEITSLTFGGGNVPVGMRIDSATGLITWTPTAAQLLPAGSAPYSYAVAVDDNNDPSDGFAQLGPLDVTVVSRLSNEPPTITSTVDDLRSTSNGGVIYEALGDDPENDPLTWTLVSGPGLIDPITGVFTWDPTVDPIETTATAVIQVRDPYGPGQQQGIVLELNESFTPGNTVPRITSTPTLPGDGGETYRYFVRATDDDGHAITLLQPTVDNPAGVSFTFVDNGNGTGVFEWVNPQAGVTRTFTFIAEDELGLQGGQTITLTIGSSGTMSFVDTPPTIDNEPPKVVAIDEVYFHQVLATDPDGPLTYTIIATRLDMNGNDTGVSVPSLEGAIDANGLINWTPLMGEEGAIRVRIRATQNGVSAIQTYTLNVIEPGANLSPALEPAVPLEVAPGQSFVFDIPGEDPQGEPIEFFLIDEVANLVREVSGLQLTSDGRLTWEVPIDAAVGSQRMFSVVAIDDSGQRSNQEDYTITVVADRPPSAGLSVTTRRPEADQTVGFSIFADDDVMVQDIRLVITRDMTAEITEVTVTGNNSAEFVIPTDAAENETFTAVVTVTDSAGQSVSANITLTVRGPNLSAPRIDIDSPGSGFLFEENTDVFGRIYDLDNNLVYYSVTATPYGGGATITLLESEWDGFTFLTNLSPGTKLATLSPFALADGTYRLDIVARDDGGEEASQSLVFGIESEAKLGNFGLSFIDITVPVAGVPITVIRSYDTQDTGTRGEFGYGWSLDVVKGKFEFLPAGSNNDFTDFLGYGTPIVGGSRVTITLPGGEEHGFTIVPVSVDQGSGWGVDGIQGLFGTFALALRPDEGQDSALDFIPSPGASFIEHFNYPADYEDFMAEHAFLDGFLSVRGTYNDETGEFFQQGGNFGVPINFDSINGNFRLQTGDQSVYEFDIETQELIKVSDVNGNQLIIDDDEFTALNAQNEEMASLKINRTNGLITSIVDPNGETITYAYDANDDLIAVTDRAANRKAIDLQIPAVPTTIMRYGEDVDDTPGWTVGDSGIDVPVHILTSIDNALGVSVLQVGFDTDGRITQLRDASGQSAGFEYTIDLGDGRNVESLKDANSVPTEIVRDSRGNVLRRIQRVSDNGTGTPSDDIYLVSVFDYDDDNNQTAVYEPFTVDEAVDGLDARLNLLPPAPALSTTTYDEDGRPEVITDALNNPTTFDFDPNGNLEIITDALNNATLNYYFSDGKLRETQNAEGEITRYRYDFQGNLNRVAQVVNGVEITQSTLLYDFAGRLVQSTNQDGISRYFAYDAVGNQTHSWFVWEDPNNPGTFTTIASKITYDAEGQATASSQFTLAGQNITTSSALDPLLTTPDWTTSTTYDALGRVVATTDRFDSASYNLYDSRGNIVERRTQTQGTNLWIVSRMAYDNNGRAIASANPIVIENDKTPTDPLFDPAADIERKPDGTTALPNADYRATHTIYDDLGRAVETRRLKDLTAQITLTADGPNFSTSFDDTYDDVGWDPTTFADLLSHSLTQFDDQGRVFKTTSADGLETYFEYDVLGRQKAVVQVVDFDQDGVEASDLLDANGMPGTDGIPDTGDDVVRTETTYDAVGRQETATDANGTVTRFVYDRLGRVEQTIADEGGLTVTTSTEYDDQGRRSAEIDPLGQRKEFEYDDSERLIEVRLPEIIDDALDGDPSVNANGSITGTATYQYDYGIYGNQTLIRDPMDNDLGVGGNNKETTFTYDHRNRQISRTLPDGLVERMFYDDTPLASLIGLPSSVGLGQRAFGVDFEGNVSRFFYDNTATGRGRLVATRYYAAADLATAGIVIDSTTTTAQLATAIDGAAGLTTERSVTYQVDALGRTTTTTDDAFATPTTRTFDVEGRTTQIDSPQGIINYEYDDLGRLTRTYTGLADPSGTSIASDGKAITDTRYAYDELGRLKTITVAERNDTPLTTPEDTKYRYDANGNLDHTELPNGVISDYVYDDLNRLDLLTHFVDNDGDKIFNGTDVLKVQYDYAVRADGKRTQEIESDATGVTRQIDWVYDSLGRLTEERHDMGTIGTADADDFIARYGFDLASNRILSERNNGNADSASFNADETTIYTHDQNDRLLTENTTGTKTTSITYEYGGPGNPGTKQTLKTVTDTVSETHVFVYDAQGRLAQTSVTKGASITVSDYKYNDRGVRVQQTVSVDGGTPKVTEYHIDPQNHTGHAKAIEEIVDGVLKRSYAFGHEIISQADATGTPSFFLHDGHGSTRMLLDALAATVERYAYDAFGKTQSGVGLTLADAAATTWLFAGDGQYDVANGLTNHIRRWRQEHRFLSTDPFAGNINDPQSLHKYLYTHADPVNGIDPTGLFEVSLAGLSASFASLAQSFAIVSTGVTAGFSAASAGVYSYFFNASPINGALVGAQVGAALSVSFSLGGGGVKGWENVGRTVAAGFFAGINKLIAKTISRSLVDSQEPWDKPAIAQDFYEGFAAGVWSRTFGDFLDLRTGVEDPLTRALATLGFTVSSQIVLAFPDIANDRISFTGFLGDVLYDTIPAWLQGSAIDAVLAAKGIPQPLRGGVKTTLTATYITGADSFVKIFEGF